MVAVFRTTGAVAALALCTLALADGHPLRPIRAGRSA
jgi:hypothetical protein